MDLSGVSIQGPCVKKRRSEQRMRSPDLKLTSHMKSSVLAGVGGVSHSNIVVSAPTTRPSKSDRSAVAGARRPCR